MHIGKSSQRDDDDSGREHKRRRGEPVPPGSGTPHDWAKYRRIGKSRVTASLSSVARNVSVQAVNRVAAALEEAMHV